MKRNPEYHTRRADLVVHLDTGAVDIAVATCDGADRARRIAAALNYVEGVPTEELEACVRDGRPLLVLAAASANATAEVKRFRSKTPPMESCW